MSNTNFPDPTMCSPDRFNELMNPVGPAPLTFARFREANVRRCNETYHPDGGIAEWSPSDWATALGGEVGEALNEVKKLRRIAETPEVVFARDYHGYRYAAHVANVADELADIVAYADLLAARLGIDLGEAVARKFNQVSERVGSPVKL